MRNSLGKRMSIVPYVVSNKFTNTHFTFRIALRFLFRRQAFSEGLRLPQKQNRITKNHTPEPPTANNNHHRNHGRRP
jgi:hypothetical protein